MKKAKEVYEILCQKQEANLTNPTPQLMEEENKAYQRLEFVAGLEEKYLKQKSKLHWMHVGHKNNKIFHRAAETREAENGIKEIQCQDGHLIMQGDEIKTEAERYFREFLQYIPNDFDGVTVEGLQLLLPFRCSKIDQKMLTRTVSGKEIKKFLFSMSNDKSPWPVGYTSEFYKAIWELTEKEVILAIQSFFAKGFLPKGTNSTILALIPKKREAKEMKDYRTFSCYNVIYKVISDHCK